MPRRVLLALLSATLAACGGRAPAPDPDRQAVRERVATYIHFLLATDGQRACAQLTPEFRRRSEERAQAGAGLSCAEAMSLYGEAVDGLMPKRFARQASDPRRVIVTLDGGRAEAALRLPGGAAGLKRATLRRVGERWLIDDLGGIRPR